MKEREINLIDLIVEILLRWRKIIVVMLIGAVLLGAYSVVSSFMTNRSQTAKVEQAETDLAELKETIGTAAPTEAQTKEMTELQKTITTGVTVYPGISVMKIVLGAFLGAFLYVFVFFVMYVMDNTIKVTDDIKDLYGITQLGLIVEQRKSDKKFGKIDDMIIWLRDRNKRSPAEVKSLKLAYVAVKLAAKKADLEKVHFIGCDIKGHSQYVCEQLKAALSKDGIEVEVLNNVLYDASAMNKLEKVKDVVLVELAGSTTYKEILRELELMQRQEINVLGGIIVE